MRLWLAGVAVLDEGLCWRDFQREVRGAVLFPCRQGMLEALVEVGPRPRHPEHIDRDCPSRNRRRVIRTVARRHPTGWTCAPGSRRIPPSPLSCATCRPSTTATA